MSGSTHATLRAIALVRGRGQPIPRATSEGVHACDVGQPTYADAFDENEARALLGERRVFRWPTCTACRVLLDEALERPAEVAP